MSWLINKLYILIPNNLDSHASDAQQWISISVHARHDDQVLNIWETNTITTVK